MLFTRHGSVSNQIIAQDKLDQFLADRQNPAQKDAKCYVYVKMHERGTLDVGVCQLSKKWFGMATTSPLGISPIYR